MSVVLDFIFNEYLRPYQRRWLEDLGKRRLALKARQIGWSDVISLEMVLTASGLMPGVVANNCNIVSKREEDAFDVVDKCKKWVEVLRQDAEIAPFLQTVTWSASEVEFERTGFRVKSETQNPDAGRSKTGHLYLDEYAFYQYQSQIWTGATPSTFSNPDLRVSVISTPNGYGDHYHELCTDLVKHPKWSRHKCDVHDAIADGFPFVIEDHRSDFTQDQWDQELLCKFLGGENQYFNSRLLAESTHVRIASREAVLWLGIDTASVVDTTAIQCLWAQDNHVWLGDTYTLNHVQYETDTNRKRVGQVTIVDALMRHLRARGCVIDVTGDMARKVRGIANLYMMLQPLHLGTSHAILPQTISQSWKDDTVQSMKTALETGLLRIDADRRDFIYSPREAGGFVRNSISIDDDMIGSFVLECFDVSSYPVLMQDFGKVFRKWIGPNSTTFDTKRDGQGHGDAFWACALGFPTARKNGGPAVSAASPVASGRSAPDYTGYL